MDFLVGTVLKDLRRHARNPLELAIWIGIPLLIGGLMILLFGGSEGPRPQAHLLVADEDDSFVSGLLVGALSQEAAGDYIRTETVEREAGLARMAGGEATALLVIPAGFSKAVLEETPTQLRLVKNPAQRILPRIVEEYLGVLSDAHFYLHRLVGEDLKAFAAGPPAGASTFDNELISTFSVKVNGIMGRLGKYLDPLAISLADEPAPETEEESVSLGLGALLLPSLLFMALLFMAQGLGNEVWEERRQRTLRRILYSPRGVSSFVAGKMITAWILVLLVSLVALGLGYGYLELSASTLAPALLWSAFAGTALAAGMTVIQLLVPSQRAGNIVTMSIVFPLMLAGGSFFPFEAMPAWMAALGRRTPNGWMLVQLKDILFGGAQVEALLAGFAILLAGLLLLSLLAAWRLRGGFAQGE